MTNFIIRIVFDRRNETLNNPEVKAPVHIEVRKSGDSRRKLIHTSIKLKRNQYSYTDGRGVVIRQHPNAVIYKQRIMDMFHSIEQFAMSDRCRTLDDIAGWNKTDEEILLEEVGTFLNFYEKQMDKHATTKWVMQNWQSLLTRLVEFEKIQSFYDLTYENIVDFDIFLRQTIKSQPVIYKRHQMLRRVIEIAVKMGIMPSHKNPYNDFKVVKGQSAEPVVLDAKELELIEQYIPKTTSMEQIKDMYLFQVYTGLAYVDMQGFSKKDIVEAGEHKVIKSARHKTDVNYVTLFTEDAEIIAERYEYILPQMSNSNYNQYLKVLAEHAGVDKNITSHTARHTFATHCLNKGLDIMVVSKALGHTNLKQTQRYARLLPETIANQMAKVLNK